MRATCKGRSPRTEEGELAQDHDGEIPGTPTPGTPEERKLRYIGVGISLGLSFGAGVGLVFGQFLFENFVYGMPIGIVLGVAIGVGIGLLRAR